MADDFDDDVEQWFDDLEGSLAPGGRVTPARPEDEKGEAGPLRPVLSHPSTRAPRRPVVAGLDPKLEPEPVTDLATMGLTRREAQPVEPEPDSVWTEALGDQLKELTTEVRSVRRDVDQIKALLSELRRLAQARRRGMATPTTKTTIPPDG